MSDRFLFRAWDKKRKIMCQVLSLDNTPDAEFDGYLIHYEGDTTLSIIPGQNDKDFILMQCTGLKDIKGNLIFEGDILIDLIGMRSVVKFDAYSCRWISELRDGDKICLIYTSDVNDPEIIGNTYEVPEWRDKR